MRSDGVMQQVRELLAQAVTSRQAIDMGYAPGTVYKVQRQLRRNGQVSGAPPLEGQASSVAESDGPADVQRLQAENEALREQTASLQEKVAALQGEVDSLTRALRAVQDDWHTDHRGRLKADEAVAQEARAREALSQEKAKLQRKLDGLSEETRRLRQEKDETETENGRLKDYLRSKNCGWQKDFALYLQRGIAVHRCWSKPCGDR